MNRFFHFAHKWIAAIAFVQLAIWTVTGLLFTLISPESEPVAAHRASITEPPAVDVARAIAAASDAGAIAKVELRATPDGVFWIVRGAKSTARVDAKTGALAPIGAPEAEAIARRDQPGAPAVRETTRVTAASVEYRGCDAECSLPAYRVALADAAATVVYVDASTGDVTARRNDRWRLYDFLFSLHIMDYRDRQDRHHWLLRGAAILAVGTVASGVGLQVLRILRWTRRKRPAKA